MPCRTMFTLGRGDAAGRPALAGDPANGAKVFAKCQTCHEITADKNKVGPYLEGIIGRPAGSVAGFKYSEAMRNSGVTWATTTSRAT